LKIQNQSASNLNQGGRGQRQTKSI